MPKNLPYKVFILGDSQVGKTCFLIRYLDDSFNGSSLATIGMDYRLKNVEREDGSKIKLHLWDTCGQERFKSIPKMFVKGAHAIILMFSLTDKNSFNSIRDWIKKIKEDANERILIILVGNKNDLGLERQINKEEAEKLAKECNTKYYECSAKTGDNINFIFNDLIEQMVKKTDKFKENKTKLSKEKLTTKKGNSCC